jgi:sigma-B regulation protein RsbU (phosphoserine phosphatase)
VLGVFPAWTYEDSVIDLKAGDRLLLFTDGITEASDTNGQEFEETRIAAFAKANAILSASELDKRLLAQVTDFCGAISRMTQVCLSLPQINPSPLQLSSQLCTCWRSRTVPYYL